MTTVAEITALYLQNLRLTPGQFAMLLSADASNKSTADMVDTWLKGEALPEKEMLTRLALRWRDWRFDFAIACLSIIYPETWGIGGDLSGYFHLMRANGLNETDVLI